MAFFKEIITSLVYCLIFLSITATADDSAKKLGKVLTQIEKVKTDLTKKKQQHTSVKQQLAQLKKKTAILEARLKKTTKQLNDQKKILAKLNRERSQQQSKLQDAQGKLSSQINSAYRLEKKNNLKALLSKNKKSSPELILDYHKYIFLERVRQMHSTNRILGQLERNQKKIDQETKRLKSLESRQSSDKLALDKSRAKQREILKGLSNKIATQSEKLKKLLAAKKNLEKLVDKLAPHKLAKMSRQERMMVCKNFVWPTKGIIATRFGSAIEQSSWKWNGVIIKAPYGQNIRAALSGKVVYADRLTGYGLLLIIDHGNGYMSLYGHNSVLYKGLDAKVEVGELVAKVGQSDSEEPELYFAIRYNGEPIDPEKWCR